MTKSIEQFTEILQRNVSLAGLTWLRTGGVADYLFKPRTEAELLAVVAACRGDGLPIHVLGSGSNLLVREAGVRGVVVQIAPPLLSEIRIDGVTVHAGSGALLSAVITEATRAGLGGMEHLVGIPGTLGGAVVGNSGGRTGDIGQIVRSVRVLTQSNEVAVRSGDELSFSYRRSSFQDLVLLSAELSLHRDDTDELMKRMRQNWIMKRSTQPLADQSAGCIFRNPRGLSAGALIEQCGLKNASVGKARVSDRHANFIVTEAGATSTDVEMLIERIQSAVAAKFSVQLELEIQVW
jgi:UDP-N-acetylmuramate dehydrogenase